MTERKGYRIQNLSCANCAKTYEENLLQLPNVTEAEVNHTAEKIYITGDASIADLERAGRFDNIKVRPLSERRVVKTSFWKKRENYPVYGSALVALLAFIWSYFGDYSTLLYLLAIFMGGYSLFITGIQNLARLRFDMNTLMTIAVIGAVLIGEYAEAAAVVILFAISEALERYSMDKARQSIASLMDIAPNEAVVRRNGEIVTLNVEDVVVGDTMIVKPGQKVAMDGDVIYGESSISEAAITGESIPVYKQVGDSVYAGTLNSDGLLEVKVTKRFEDTTINKIIHLVEEAQAERAPSQAFVDRFAQYYTPLIIAISLIVMVVPPLFLNASWHEWLYQGLAVLIIGCPCALVISTPVAIVTAIGNAAKHGVLIKGGIHLEEAGHIETIAFDKTGTLTVGRPVVTDLHLNEDMLIKAAALELRSQHPLGHAVVSYAREKHLNIDDVQVKHFKSLTGQGVQGDIEGTTYYIGSKELFEQRGIAVDSRVTLLQEEGKTVMLFGSTTVELIIAVADQLRSEAREVITQLNDMGLNTIMLTGDNALTAKTMSDLAGLTTVYANLMPEDKLNIIKQYNTQHIAMVGDGVNDAPALASANVGIAMGKGTDTALETAHIALMSNDLKKLPYTIKLSQKTLTIIKQNISFALLTKLIALLLVIPGWLTLWIAIFSDIGATLIVTLNSMRLMNIKLK